ncbi:MAG: hypothetical protein LAN71_00285 [Acidobacteriia bacterium]|nr:hypothetical protein [Terriglobia bacterium]
MSLVDPRAPLIPGISQYDVDFVIPRVGIDVPVGIDPFLLYKSRDSEYRQLHGYLLEAFNAGIAAVKHRQLEEAGRVLDFPEVSAIGMGYTQRSKRGSGVGSYLTELIIKTVLGSPSLQERGIRHVEEMQLLSTGIGPDRVSDIAANVLKRFLIEYTKRQCVIWSLPVKRGVPVNHIYDVSSGQWTDAYEDLPVNPNDGSPILLVPRRIVRVLPWINYDDFVRTEFNAYLAAKRQAVARHLKDNPEEQSGQLESNAKPHVTTVTRSDISLVDRYVRSREQHSAEAHPALDYIDDDRCKEAEKLKARLSEIQPGREHAVEYQRLVLEMLNFLFNPELVDGQPEVRTIDGTERRDIIFTNDSDESFWSYVRTTHDGILVMFEAKNTNELGLPEINQTATYLGDRIGRLGVVVTRREPPETVQRKIFSVWNDSAPHRKVILTLCDKQLRELLDLRCQDGSPTRWMQSHYRMFRTSVQ